MVDLSLNKETKDLHINGKGLFSNDEVFVSISKEKPGQGIVFLLNNREIKANIGCVSNTARNTVLSSEDESLCLVEHFLSACSVMGIDDISVKTNTNELVFEDGSAAHWQKLFESSNWINKVEKKYDLKEPVLIKDEEKTICAIPADNFKASYFMDWNHPALGKLWVTWENGDDISKLLRARTFANKMENDFFGVSDRLLTLLEDKFNKELHEQLEPAYHKVLDIIGDLRLLGVNPLEIGMHVISFKGGHDLNIKLAKSISKQVPF